MKNDKINLWIRIAIAICGLALFVVLFVPIWRIDLAAPQYPEGLRLLIYANKLGGDFDIINGLNHYIGMKTLHANDFIEFSVLTYIIGSYALLFIIVAAVGNRKFMYVLLGLFATFGILAMADFWRWEYNYGHNLDPKAAIIVPGMAYQPPLIGYKQLLNFGAYSIPDIGGWIFIAAGVTLLVCVIVQIKLSSKVKKSLSLSSILFIISTALFCTSCSAQPKQIKLGINQCDYCKMTLSDARFPAEIVTQKGKVFIFDDAICAIKFIKENKETAALIKDVYLSNYNENHRLVNVKNVHLYKSDELRSPMGGNIASFENIDSLSKMMKGKNGIRVIWVDLLKL